MTQKTWNILHQEAKQLALNEPLLAKFSNACVLRHNDLAEALAFILSNKLSDNVMPAETLNQLFLSAYAANPAMADDAATDIRAIIERDPAVDNYLTPLLYLKGFHAIQTHRLAHHLWKHKRQSIALYIQHRNSMISGVDIHPAAHIGRGVMFDHATGIVIGETAVIEDNVSLLHGVTLGGTGNDSGDRHPKVRKNVMIGAGAKILGNIEIGEGARVGAGSVVLQSVACHTTVVGVPAVKVGKPKTQNPCRDMNQNIFDDAD